MAEKALIFLYPGALLNAAQLLAREEGFHADHVNPGKPINGSLNEGHSRYLVDLSDYDFARQLYDRLKPRISTGEARFLGISDDMGLVDRALNDGMPAHLNTGLEHIRQLFL